MKYKILCLLLVMILTMSFCSCKVTSVDGKKEIAVIVKSVSSDFWHNVESGVNSAATEYNVSVTFEGPESEEDYIEQNNLILKAIENKVDAIVLSAIDYDKNVAAVDKAAKEGIKIVTIDSNVNSENVSMFIGTDNANAGRDAAKAACKNFKRNEQINIGIVNYSRGTDNGRQREKGFTKYVNSVDNAKIVGTVYVDSNVTSATAGAISLLNNHPEINVLVGFNEFMTLGIGNAINQGKLTNKVCGIGFDTNVKSIGMIETGEMDALIVQNSFAIGYLGVKNAADLIDGKDTENEIITDTYTITKQNLFDEDSQKILFHFQVD